MIIAVFILEFDAKFPRIQDVGEDFVDYLIREREDGLSGAWLVAIHREEQIKTSQICGTSRIGQFI